MPGVNKGKQIGLWLGPAVFLLILLLPLPVNMEPAALKVAAVAALMATWWTTEAIPIAVTALLPVVLFPFLGVMSTADTTPAYAHHLIYLFLGGFLIARAMQKWQLHRRIAIYTIALVGVSSGRVILGFMLSTAFLSMWISNTATTLMMLPIGVAVIEQIDALGEKGREGERSAQFGTALMLGIAYSASIGGVATLIGTPPNAILAGIVEQLYGQRISFAAWLAFGLPLALTMLALTWLYLTRIAFRHCAIDLTGVSALIEEEIMRLGPISPAEKRVLLVFVTVSLGWISRGFLPSTWLSGVTDASIAIAGAIALFIIPANRKQREFLLDWKTAVDIPWDIIVLFGGGFALAQGFISSGLSDWIALQLAIMEGAPLAAVVGVITLAVIFLTEITSNTATATLMIPVMGALAVAMGIHPYALMIPAAIAASFAFMLPVATPPNAIVFASRKVSVAQMAATGFWLNLIATLLIGLFVLLILPLAWNLDLNTLLPGF